MPPLLEAHMGASFIHRHPVMIMEMSTDAIITIGVEAYVGDQKKQGQAEDERQWDDQGASRIPRE